jgi:glycosyltransferase involved in cell wall biosynthesis
MRAQPPAPLVSICMPAFDAEDTIADAIESALAQTVTDFELVVVDDVSSDGTREIVRRYTDPRIRLIRNERNIGGAASATRAVAAARGEFVKFLDADDLLDPDCTERLLEAIGAAPDAGFAFCRRRLLVEREADVVDWIERYGDPPGNFSSLGPVNDGRRLLREWMRAGLWGNWIGEPATALLRRRLLVRTGGYPRYARFYDKDLWLRCLALSDAAFVDAELATYRLRAGSMTISNSSRSMHWLDRLWTLEGLRAFPLPSREARLRRGLLARAWTHAVADVGRAAVRERASARRMAAELDRARAVHRLDCEARCATMFEPVPAVSLDVPALQPA